MVATRSSSKAPESAPPPPPPAAAAAPPPPAVASAATPAATTTATTAPTTRSRPARTNNNNNANKSAVAAAAPSTSTSISTSTSTPTTTTTAAATTGWAHTPSTLTLAWLALSLPLVIWDTGYVLGRPATMPGGWAHAPFYTPYALYGEVDHMYGLKQWAAGNGFTSAQGTLNVVETLFYLAYLAIWSRAAPARATGTGNNKQARSRKPIAGRAAAWAVLFAFSAAVMTLSKTVLYWLNEVFSDFDNIGHNALGDLILLWIIPNGAWLIGPTYMIYQLGAELVDAINIASQATGSVKEE